MCICLHACLCTCARLVPVEVRKGNRSYRRVLSGAWWEVEAGLLGKEPVVLTMEPPLPPPSFKFLYPIINRATEVYLPPKNLISGRKKKLSNIDNDQTLPSFLYGHNHQLNRDE